MTKLLQNLEEFYICQGAKIFNQDCQQGLKQLSKDSIDFIVTDPPYFIDGMGNEWNDTNLKTKAAKSGVIGGLPVGMKFDKSQGEKLQNFMNPLAKEFYRILKPGGFCIVFSQARLYHRMAMSLDLAGFEIRDMLAWKYEAASKGVFTNSFYPQRQNIKQGTKRIINPRARGI